MDAFKPLRDSGRPLSSSWFRVCWGLAVLMGSIGPVAAEELRWLNDYNQARREALTKGAPLVIDFGTSNCYWCNKLDASTFRDPTVVNLMNEKFVSLKVDAQKNAPLTEALHIQSFPTLVLADPEGKIIGTVEGFVEADRFHEQLQKVLASVQNPEWMSRDFQEAAKAMAASDFTRAVALLKSITEDKKDRPIQLKARQVLSELEEQAAGRLAHARTLEDKGQTSEGIEVLTGLVRNYAGTPAATEGGQMLAAWSAKPEIKARERTRRARELLAQAREDYRSQAYLCCLDRCESLISGYADLAEAAEAAQLAAEIKGNPDWMRQACDTLSDRLGGLYVALAETWLAKGQPKEAILCLERVIQSFPGTRRAEAAQTRLAQIQGQPTQRTTFKIPKLDVDAEPKKPGQ